MWKLRKIVAVIAVLATAENAFAGNILRRGAAPNAATAPADAAQAAAAAAAAQANAAAQYAQGPLRQALDAIKQYQAAQQAARAAAKAASSAVPNGLVNGGLVVAPGVGQDPALWQGAALPTQTTEDGRTAVTVAQKEEKAILTWTTFNVGKETDVVFDQKTAGGDAAASWIALNRVVDPKAAPSQILGSIRADGQVYVINRNGIIFGGTSQVNVGTLVASSLDIFGGDQRFRAGLLSQGGLTFGGDGIPGGAVLVEAGARLSIGNYGQALLLGGEVANRGSIEAPDGQVLLAAGSGVSLAGSTTSNLRGYALSAPVTGGGPVENTGVVSTPRGNITLAGDSVRQGGLLTATTSGEASGSIHLGQAGGATTFTEGSVTQVLPDDNGKKVIGASPQDFQRSEIQVSGERITLLGDSRIYAPSGNVALSAAVSPDQTGAVDGTRIYVEKGASIDVSGLRDVELPMEQNTTEAQLRANELRDNPLLRDNPELRGRTVWFDRRLGVKVADLSGYDDLVPRDVKEFMTQGGTLSLAANEILTRQGSTIDLSGGSLRYLDGYVKSSVLVDAAGNHVRIEDAKKDVNYVGLEGDFVVNHSRWGVTETYAAGLARSHPRFEAGYVEGSSAGTLNVSTNALPGGAIPDPHPTGEFRIFDGAVAATTVVGPKQRDMPSSSTDPTQAWRKRPSGGTLNIDRAGDVTIADVGPQLPAGFGPDGTLDAAKRYEQVLQAAWFDGRTFSNVNIKSGYTDDPVIDAATGAVTQPGSRNLAPGGHLTIGSGVVVDLGDGGSFAFSGKRADVDGTLRAAGGSVKLTALDLPEPAELAAGDRSTVRLGAAGTIDVAGRWSNDQLDGVGVPLRALNGGSVSLKAQDVTLEAGSLVDVSGGGRLNAAGNKVTPGNGGSVTLDVSQPTNPVQPQLAPFDGQLDMRGTLSGYALGAGGSISLVTPYDIVIGDARPAGAGPSTRLLAPDFFTRGGFSSYSIAGERGVTVSSFTTLSPTVETLVMPDRPGEIASGSRVADVATRQVLPDGQRAPMKLSLSTVPVRELSPNAAGDTSGSRRDVVVETGASIRMAPGSTVQLSSPGTVCVDGTIETPGGTIQLTGRSGQELGVQMDALGAANVRLGAHAQLLAAGYEKATPDGNLVRRSVESGGTVAISAPHEVLIDPGAVIDVHGVKGVADLDPAPGAAPGQERFAPVLVDGNAGSIAINAGSGVLAGQLRLSPGGETGHGGSLTIGAGSPVVVRQDAPAWFLDLVGTTGVTPDGPGRASLPGTLTVVADAVNASGADDLVLRATATSGGISPTGQLLFEGEVALRTRRSLTLGFPQIGTVPGASSASADLESRYVQLAGGVSADQPIAYATDLRGDLTVRADVIDIANSVWLGCASLGCSAGGFGTARFVAAGDIRLSDHDASGSASTHAGLFSNGALTLESAQVYPTRLLNPADPGLVPGFLVQSDVSVTVTGNGNPAPVPYSFGESLTLRAPVIVQGGVIRAPQGQIRLEGTGPDGSVTLLPGSLTSASMEGLVVPFGAVATGGSFTGFDAPGQAPEKSVRLDARDVAVRPGAVIDVSGRGDLLGYVFVPGNGGSSDILSSSNGFAVLPGLGAAPAPAGGSGTLQDSRLHVGDSVWLQGVPGLADGFYTLLPAHYALLPGGLFIQPLGGSLAAAPATGFRDDGAAIAAGYRAVAGTPIRDQGYGQFLVMPREVFEKYSDLRTYSFDAYAQGLAASAGVGVRGPNDAGSVVLAASRSLSLEGTGRFDAGPDGLLGNLDISAPKIAVVGAGASAPAPGDGYLVLQVQALENFGAGSVLLGGTRSAATDPSKAVGTAVTVSSSEVVVDTGAATPWVGPEILLAATGSVSVRDGSVIQASGPGSRDVNPLLLQGEGALLRLSTGNRVGIVRSDAGAAAPDAALGNLSIGNASLSADGSLSLYGSRNIALSPQASLSGRQFDVASVVVNLGDAPAGTAGTTLGADTMARLASSADLLIRGTDSIHVFGDLALGGRDGGGQATLQKITLDTGLLQGEASSSGGARITAREFTLRNSGGGAAGSGAPVAGALALDVDTLVLGPGDVRLAGYQSLQGTAGAIEARGRGGLTFAGDLAIATGQVRAASGASYALDVGGSVALTPGGGAGAAADVKSLGGSLSIAASSIALDTSVVLPAGTFEAAARNGALEVGANASIDVSGRAVDFRDQVRLAPGGGIRLQASGDVSVASGAVIDVSGSAPGGKAGRLQVAAGGTASLQGDLRGSAAAGAAGGSFSLDAARVGTDADLSALNGRLEVGGFDASREIRLRQQDIALGANEAIHAHDVVLRSDSGRVTVAGEIAAAGTAAHPDGGAIRLVGGAGVAVEGTARLDARAGEAPVGGFEPASGKVEIAATGGRVDVAPGAVIDVSGGRQGGGSVVIRAGREGGDVAVDRLSGEIRGAREVAVVGVADYQASVVDAPLVDRMLGDASTWLQAGRDAIRARLGGSLPDLQVGSGMEVTSSGDLTLQADIDLARLATSTPGTASGPGYLGFVAPGRIEIQGAVSDGFANADRYAALASGRSFSYGFESGGDTVLGPNALLRTGTGDISIQAGRDLVLSDRKSAIYTAGARTDWASGFAGAPSGMPLGAFPTQGGDIDIRAGRDVVAPLAAQTTSAWLFRYGDTDWNGLSSSSTVKQQTSWSVVYGNFEQAVGALGGGDVRVDAGRDVVQLQVAIPTTGQLTTPVGGVARDADLVVRGGGELDLSAGRDILGGLFVLGRGHAELRAGGQAVASPGSQVALRTTDTGQVLGSSRPVGALIGLMDATATLTAGSTVDIEGAFDPMSQGQLGGAGGNLNGAKGSAFMGYTDRTSLDATSIGGSIFYENDPWASVDLSSGAYQVRMSGQGSGAGIQATSLNSTFSRAPGTLRLASLTSSAWLKDPFDGQASQLTLGSAPRGTLEVLAHDDVHLLLTVNMEGDVPEVRRGALQPFSTAGDATNPGIVVGPERIISSSGAPRIHAGDPEPARIVALDGSVCAYRSGSCVPDVRSLAVQVDLSKPIDVYAGKDVMAGDYQVRGDTPDALSRIQAGRDVYDVVFTVNGSGGTGMVEAGRDVILHLGGQDVTSRIGGRLLAAGDPTRGNTRASDLYIMAGRSGGVDLDAFAAAYLDPSNAKGVVRTYLPELREYMKGLGVEMTDDAALVAAFRALPEARREVFLDRVFFTELRETGIEYNDSKSPRHHSYDRGFRAVSLLFPGDPAKMPAGGLGSVLLDGKVVETQANGDINVLAPYGRIAVGTELADPGGKGGIVTRRGGDIRMMSDQNIDLYTSRVFTLQGGDILMWTSDGSITAGSGAKTSVFYAPLKYTISVDGVVQIDAFGLQTGAGIGVLDALQNAGDRPRSRLDLIAPKGEVNAGDAGIRVVGDLNIAARVVVGTENIQVSGASQGVPTVEAPNIGALTSASQLTQAAAKEGVGPEAAPRTQLADLPSIITVEPVGYETQQEDEENR